MERASGAPREQRHFMHRGHVPVDKAGLGQGRRHLARWVGLDRKGHQARETLAEERQALPSAPWRKQNTASSGCSDMRHSRASE